MEDNEKLTQEKVPKELQKVDWLSGQILNSPLKSVFIMLLIAISTMGTITVFFYNKQANQIEENREQYKFFSAKQELEAKEYKQNWIDCMNEKIQKIEKTHSITKKKKK